MHTFWAKQVVGEKAFVQHNQLIAQSPKKRIQKKRFSTVLRYIQAIITVLLSLWSASSRLACTETSQCARGDAASRLRRKRRAAKKKV